MQGFALFLQKNSNYKFYWIGRIGWVFTEPQMHRLAKEYQIENSFIFLGYVDEESKASWIRNCTAIIYLSLYEGFGLPVLEGMTYNKPSVVSDGSSLPEVVGNTGIKCNPNDTSAITEAFQHVIDNRNKLMSQIPDQLKKFDPDVQISNFLLTIQNFLD
jgi:glycosyltransferase involved in cell wall biosynthesis